MAPQPGKPAKPKKAWRGEKRNGPAPARHIPWPEIFKHHISVVEGHTKMLEMVQKHTVKGTGNYATITDLVKRGYEMLRQAKEISRTFIPPSGQREMVPLGSSSESMYPGYSPAHIEYGKAAAEVGQAVGEMRARGEKWELPANGPEYQIGQAHGAKRSTLLKKDRTESNGSEGKPKEAPEESQEGAEQEKEAGDSQYFVIDTNPTPVVLPRRSSKKRAAAEEGEEDDGEDKNSKKEKKKKKEKETEDVIETEDISAEVEARLKAKEEKAKAKEEKKRKRDSMGDESEKVLKKSKKEKSKKREAENGDEGAGDGEGKKKKLKKRKEKDAE